MQLPAALAELQPLALNLRWSWHAPTRDAVRAHRSRALAGHGHNPVRLLAEVGRARLDELATDAASSWRRVRGGRGPACVPGRRRHVVRAHARPGRRSPLVAYFSAEFGITECLRIFSGGLGVLAGDHLKSASDLGVPLVGVGLFYSQGYFTQQIDAEGNQHDATRHARPAPAAAAPVLGEAARRCW
jgi:glycogen phosphorylase